MRESAFLEAVRQRVVIYDGAMGPTLQRMNLTPEDYGLDLYRYETSVSVGSEMGARMEQNLRALLLTDGRKRARVGKH